ncbi:MAG TPA: protein kinase [Gemmatimonadales bacterium]|nr:protein kinase [Gemmatimonadales bacterium]
MADVLEQLRAALGDRYEVERLVGEGGMATVFLAKDLRHGRKVAVKTLRAELAASIGADRFLREIRLAANLQHPNILGLYDSGEADGLLYYVMPFVEGESLRARLDREQQLPIHEAVRITREAAEALAYAHAQGVVHRDIKPENILLQNGHALVADFGIARAVDAAGEKLTQTGMAVGTPHYMSPEQAMGADGADGRSDVYSLGCVLYELLVGQPPFDGPNARAILARHTMEPVPSVTVVRPSVPDEIEDAVLQALEKTPADRYQKMADFADALADLESAVAVRRTTPRGMTAERRAAPRATRSTRVSGPASEPASWFSGARLWTVVGGVVLAGAAVAGWLLWGRPGTATERPRGGLNDNRIAVLYFDNIGGGDSLDYLASGLTEGLIRELSQVQTLDVVSTGGVAPFRGSTVSRDSIARALQAGALVAGGVERVGGQLRVTVRLVDGQSGVDLTRTTRDLPAGDLLAVQDTLVQEVARQIRSQLGQEIQLRQQRRRASDVRAWTAVQQAARRQEAAEAAAARGDNETVRRELDAADSLLAAAEALDPTWPEPVIARAAVAYRHSRLELNDQVAADKLIETGMGHVDRALALAPQDPDALELRGNLRYWRWLLSLEPDAAKARTLLASAQEDLETAVRLSPSQAGAWATLSHLKYQTGNLVDVKLAAQRAYEEDAYLSNADVVLSRLFFASYDLGQFTDAEHWCDVGQRRFPADVKFVECQLFLLTSRARDPDVALAWRLADSVSRTAPEQDRAFQTLNARMMVAATLARAGQPDSARRLALRSKGNNEIDPTRDLVYASAFVHTLLGDTALAVDALKQYLVANSEKRAALASDPTWWFRPLENNALFREAVGASP